MRTTQQTKPSKAVLPASEAKSDQQFKCQLARIYWGNALAFLRVATSTVKDIGVRDTISVEESELADESSCTATRISKKPYSVKMTWHHSDGRVVIFPQDKPALTLNFKFEADSVVLTSGRRELWSGEELATLVLDQLLKRRV